MTRVFDQAQLRGDIQLVFSEQIRALMNNMLQKVYLILTEATDVFIGKRADKLLQLLIR